MNISLSPFAPENLVSRDGFGSPVPRQPAHTHTQAESGASLQDSSRFPWRRPFIYLNRQTSSSQSRVYRVTELRTDGAHSAHPHTQAGSGAYLQDSSRFPWRRPFIYLNRHTPLNQSRVYRVTQLRTDGVHSAHPHTQAESCAYLQDSSRFPWRSIYLFKPSYAIGSVLSLSSHAMAYRWRSLPRVRRHRASKPQGTEIPNGCCLGRSPWIK